MILVRGGVIGIRGQSSCVRSFGPSLTILISWKVSVILRWHHQWIIVVSVQTFSDVVRTVGLSSARQWCIPVNILIRKHDHSIYTHRFCFVILTWINRLLKPCYLIAQLGHKGANKLWTQKSMPDLCIRHLCTQGFLARHFLLVYKSIRKSSVIPCIPEVVPEKLLLLSKIV